MGIALDHVFVGCRPGAPEADFLLEHGFLEGSGNTHPGQGTANRRFFFDNFKLEFIWVNDEAEATSERTRGTRLWERCSASSPGDSPYGILFRSDGDDSPPPFRTRPYFPAYLPAGLAIEVAEGTPLREPELFCLPFVRAWKTSAEPTQHRLPFRRIRSLAVGVCDVPALSEAAAAVQALGQVRYFASEAPLLELHFEGTESVQVDFRPALPLVFRMGEHDPDEFAAP